MKTARLFLRPAQMEDAEKLEKFYQENHTHFSPWESPFKNVAAQLYQWACEEVEGTAVRLLLFTPEEEIIGLCNFTQIFRGPFQACYLGYKIGERYEGQGLMFEALVEAIPYVFEERNLHRIMANYMPSNTRSARLLERLGFQIEGLAKNYLFINGKWEDHVLTSLINPDWKHL